jgi:4-hydroxy-2-oxoglutarate aldolase
MAPFSDKLNLAGIFPPIPTPFDEQERVDLDRLSENLARWELEPLDGYVVGGSNGEFVSLSQDERLQVVRHVCAQADTDKLIIAGSGVHSTRETILQTEAMAKLGAQAALVVTPGYYKGRMDEQALIAHYTRVADHSPVPIILYNVPANTGINMDADTIVPLSEHANIVAEITQRAPKDFQVLAGSASFLLSALVVGAVGTISALANIAGRALSELMQAFEKGDLEQAKKIQQNLVLPNSAVTNRFGVAGLKFALDLVGYYGGLPRSPLQGLNDEQRSQVRQILIKAELLPLS